MKMGEATRHSQEVGEVRAYLEALYKSASESSWATFLLDKNQSIVFATTMSMIISCLWMVSLTGMWLWSTGGEMTVGISMFCASFSFTNVKFCHILPGESLQCPPDFQGPRCISWYDSDFKGQIGLVVGMQVTGLLGTVDALVCTGLGFYTLLKVADQGLFRKNMRAGSIIMAVSGVLALITFILFLANPYLQSVQQGKDCVLLISDGAVICTPSSNLEPPIRSSYGFTACVVVFAFSVLTSGFFAMGALKEHYDNEKEE